ncbi:MAG: efflux RND transporter periplasmic adaptor subunit [Elusimicrobiota bacterium]
MRKNKLVILILAVFIFGAGGLVVRFRRGASHGAGVAPEAVRYYCPMHPTYTSDRPGACPICNMSLVPMETPDASGAAAQNPAGSGKKVCLLHNCNMANCPMELELKPGQKVTCPVCGTHVEEAQELAQGKILYYRHPVRPELTSPSLKKDEMGMDYVPVYAEKQDVRVPVGGQAGVTLTAERRRLIGMESQALVRRDLKFTVRASGRVAYDPDLYNAIAEYREAVRTKEQVKENSWPDVQDRSQALVRASLLRLRQSGLSESQIEDIARSTGAQSTNLLLGGSEESVWVYAQIYEYEIGFVKSGQRAEITTPAYRGRKFYGTVKAVDPILSAETRSLKVRIEVPNPEGLLKLEMYVNAEIRVDIGFKLALPEEALMETGERQLVFIDLGQGRIEPREVRIGQEAKGYYEVISGIREGERVVTSANFLIDSESKLKAAISTSKDKAKGKGDSQPADSFSEHRH